MLQREYKVARIGIFGSRARGDSLPRSDIDILVQFKEPVGLFLFSGLKQFLESIFGLDVDLATPDALRDEFREDVLKEVAYA
ncbi:MAG: nucleotidyltransferase family protein [Candidatus Sigynarchaeota archaeon]